MLDLERLVRESGKPHRIIAAAADCTEATLNRILKGRVQTCKLDTLESIAAAWDTRSSWSRRRISRGWHPASRCNHSPRELGYH